ncbi:MULTISPECIES: hypothetical protein [Aeromonas]|uniref:Uncharacterized protein n=1 Tax=Aeromonas caviae TaxID=648 RepID=A0AAI9KQU3_AERCA|nr:MULTISPECIES: hypothetical protein [Aeromonas]EJN6954307.1 hypothetical protein [Aeromonas hydrophila]KER62496.1 hypothetical protein HR52_05455 [Aeromonas hydrophila]OCA67585.1 hypothetical protein A9R12_02805 [Aeromonas hydrophila]CAD7532975.1 hypothetical protein KBAH04_19590 [Aeromonas hydrophila]GJA53913.1 hypothetical protein KAM348_13360 [Aeromonas caviae]
MRLNRDVLITGIVRHQNVFFALLDHIDKNDGSLEFPEFLYLNLYSKVICEDSTPNIQTHLSMESLLENGVFVSNDRNTGMVTIENIIVELLRFLDVKRTKELTHFDFEQLRKRTVQISEDMMQFEFGKEDYLDARNAFNTLMSEIHSKIKANVAALTAQVEAVAQDYKAYDEGECTISVFDLYERVRVLYARYVMPCLEFINPKMEMVRTINFSRAVQQLIDYHCSDEIQRFDIANVILSRKTAITSYYKDLAVLVKKLEQFTSHLARDRNNYLAIQSAFTGLMDSVKLLRHGQKRNMYLTGKADYFKQYSSLDGLSSHNKSYSSRFTWEDGKTDKRFNEYLNLLENTEIKPKMPALKPLPSSLNVTQERQIQIFRLLFKQKYLPAHIPDVQAYLHDTLRQTLPEFCLVDVLYGLEAFMPLLPPHRVKSNRQRGRMTDDTYYLNYIVLELVLEHSKEPEHV